MSRRPDLAFRGGTASNPPATGRPVGGSLAVVALLVAGLGVVSYPTAAVAALVFGGPVAAGVVGLRHAATLVRRRRRSGQAKKICIPTAGICIEA